MKKFHTLNLYLLRELYKNLCKSHGLHIAVRGFFDINYENDEDVQEFLERFEKYKSSWYLLEEPVSDGSKASAVNEVY